MSSDGLTPVHERTRAAGAVGDEGIDRDAQVFGTFSWRMQPFCNVVRAEAHERDGQCHPDIGDQVRTNRAAGIDDPSGVAITCDTPSTIRSIPVVSTVVFLNAGPR